MQPVLPAQGTDLPQPPALEGSEHSPRLAARPEPGVLDRQAHERHLDAIGLVAGRPAAPAEFGVLPDRAPVTKPGAKGAAVYSKAEIAEAFRKARRERFELDMVSP